MVRIGRTLTHVPPGEGKALVVGSDRVVLKAVSEDTGGAYTLVEATTPPNGGPVPHTHRREDEAYYILEGEYEIRDFTSGRVVRASAGSFVLVPKGTLHMYRNVGAGPGRLLALLAPAGFEKYFERVGAPGVAAPAQPLPPTLPTLPTSPGSSSSSSS